MDGSKAGTTWDQIENKFAKLNTILNNPGNDPPTQDNWWQGQRTFTMRDEQGNTATVTVNFNADKTGTISLSGFYVGTGRVKAGSVVTASRTKLIAYPEADSWFYRGDGGKFLDVGFAMNRSAAGVVTANMDRMMSI